MLCYLLLSWFIGYGSTLLAIHYVSPFKYIKKISFESSDGKIFQKIKESKQHDSALMV